MVHASALAAVASPRRREILRLVWNRERSAGAIAAAMPEVTFGAVSEEGIQFAPDGRSFVTSIGTSQSTLWIHDERGDRQITSEGYGFMPSISPDGKKLYYLVRANGLRSWNQGALPVPSRRPTLNHQPGLGNSQQRGGLVDSPEL